MRITVMLWACSGEPQDKDPAGSPSSPPEPSEQTTPDPPVIDNDADGVPAEEDCDDTDPTVYPGAPDLCGDGRLTDCDRTDEDGLVTLDGTQGFDDLGEALAAAQPGSTLLLCPGHYAGSFTASVPVTLTSLEGAEATVLDGEGQGTVLVLPGDSAVVGLTLRGGEAPSGGGLRVTSPGTLLVQDCLIRDNHAEMGGGLALAPETTTTLTGSVVQDNTASEEGGGLYVSEGSTLELGDSQVIGNTADRSGGGIALHDAHLVGGTVADNTSTAAGLGSIWTCGGPWGGGVYATGACTITGTDIHQNNAIMGSGLGVTEGHVVLTDVAVHANQGSTMGGAGISACSSELELLGTTEVYENDTIESGAGLYASSSTVWGGVYRGNVATWAGGGVVLNDSELIGALIEGNQAEHGAGVALWGGTLRESTVTGNVAASAGGGVDTSGEEGETANLVVDSILTDNQAPVGAALSVYWEASLEGCTLWRNLSVQQGAILVEEDSRLHVLDSDLGSGADDNLPIDVFVEGGGGYSFESGSFSCDPGGCE